MRCARLPGEARSALEEAAITLPKSALWSEPPPTEREPLSHEGREHPRLRTARTPQAKHARHTNPTCTSDVHVTCHVVHVHVTVCFSSCTPPIRCCRSGANHGAPPSPSRLLPAPPSPSRSLHTTNSCGASLKLKWGVARNYCFRISFENDSMINTSRYAVPRVALETDRRRLRIRQKGFTTRARRT